MRTAEEREAEDRAKTAVALKERSDKLDYVLSDTIKCAALELAVALGNLGLAQRYRKGAQEGRRIRAEIRSAAAALYDARSAVPSARDVKEWGRRVDFWLEVAARGKLGGADAAAQRVPPPRETHRQLHSLTESYEKQLRELLRRGERAFAGRLEKKFRADYNRLFANIEQLPRRFFRRFEMHTQGELCKHLKTDFTRSHVSPLQFAALGAALALNAGATFCTRTGTTMHFQRRFGVCGCCSRFYFRTDSGKDPKYCDRACRVRAGARKH